MLPCLYPICVCISIKYIHANLQAKRRCGSLSLRCMCSIFHPFPIREGALASVSLSLSPPHLFIIHFFFVCFVVLRCLQRPGVICISLLLRAPSKIVHVHMHWLDTHTHTHTYRHASFQRTFCSGRAFEALCLWCRAVYNYTKQIIRLSIQKSYALQKFSKQLMFISVELKWNEGRIGKTAEYISLRSRSDTGGRAALTHIYRLCPTYLSARAFTRPSRNRSSLLSV